MSILAADPAALAVPVIALVASAGGLEAMREVLGGLPTDLPAALIALQHLQPERPSHLAAILARHTTLNVRQAVDNDLLTAGTVHVVPAGRHAIVGPDRRIRLLSTNGYPPPRPSADLLLCTLATAVGPRAIAVVLSGNGHDGAIGVQAIDEYGGTVLVQSAATAPHPSMPTAAMRADHAEPPLPLSGMADRIRAIVGTFSPGTALPDERIVRS